MLFLSGACISDVSTSKMFGSKSANYTKLKTNLRLAINRFKLLEKKKAELAQQARREIAEQLRAGKVDRARIRVEHIIREDFMIEAMEMLEMYCDLLTARMGLIQHEKKMDEGLEEAITTLLWATPRLVQDIPELNSIAREFTHKYGTKYCEAARDNQLGTVNQKLLKKLSVQAPRQTLVEQYLIEIARNFHVDYEADPRILQELQAPLIEIGALPVPPVDAGPSNRNNNNSNYNGGGGGGGNFVMQNNAQVPDLAPQIGFASPASFYPPTPYQRDVNAYADHYAENEKPPPPLNPNLTSSYDVDSLSHDDGDEHVVDDGVEQQHAQFQQPPPHASYSSRNSTYNLPPINEKLALENPNAADATLRRQYAKAAEAAGGTLPSNFNANPSAPPGSGAPSSNNVSSADDDEIDWSNKLPAVPTDAGGTSGQPEANSAAPPSSSTNLDDLMRRFERLKK